MSSVSQHKTPFIADARPCQEVGDKKAQESGLAYRRCRRRFDQVGQSLKIDGAGNSHQFLALSRAGEALDLSRAVERSIFDENFIFYCINPE